jgi:hypothetical protein
MNNTNILEATDGQPKKQPKSSIKKLAILTQEPLQTTISQTQHLKLKIQELVQVFISIPPCFKKRTYPLTERETSASFGSRNLH